MRVDQHSGQRRAHRIGEVERAGDPPVLRIGQGEFLLQQRGQRGERRAVQDS